MDARFQNRDGQSGQFAFDNRYERMCACGHRLGSHGEGGFTCLVGTGIPQFMDDDNSKFCDCEKFKPSKRRPRG